MSMVFRQSPLFQQGATRTRYTKQEGRCSETRKAFHVNSKEVSYSCHRALPSYIYMRFLVMKVCWVERALLKSSQIKENQTDDVENLKLEEIILFLTVWRLRKFK